MSSTSPGEVTISVVTFKAATNFSVFRVLVQVDDSPSWTVDRRFSQFDALFKILSSRLQCPELPPKTWFRSLDETFLEQRRQQLDDWMKQLSSLLPVTNSLEWREFLEIHQRVEEHSNNPKTGGFRASNGSDSLRVTKFGIASFALDAEHGLVIAALEDASLLSRADATMSNFRFPWEEEGHMVPCGGLATFIKSDGLGGWSEKIVRHFVPQANCLAWDSQNRVAFVGLANGSIHVITLSKSFDSVIDSEILEAHEAQVSKVVLDKTRDLLISVSRDGTLRVYNIGNKKFVASVHLCKSWVLSLDYDQVAARAFCGTWHKEVKIVQISSDDSECQLVHTLYGHKDAVRAMFYSRAERYLFAGSVDATASVWSVAASGSVANPVAWLRDGPRHRILSITFCPSMRVVFAGHDLGFLSMWDVTTGHVIDVCQGHDNAVTCLEMVNSTLVSASRDGTVKWWQFPTVSSKATDLSSSDA